MVEKSCEFHEFLDIAKISFVKFFGHSLTILFQKVVHEIFTPQKFPDMQ